MSTIFSIVEQNFIRSVVYHDALSISCEINWYDPWRGTFTLANLFAILNIIQIDLRDWRTISNCKYWSTWREFHNWNDLFIRIFEILYFFNVLKFTSIIETNNTIRMSNCNSVVDADINGTNWIVKFLFDQSFSFNCVPFYEKFILTTCNKLSFVLKNSETPELFIKMTLDDCICWRALFIDFDYFTASCSCKNSTVVLTQWNNSEIVWSSNFGQRNLSLFW